jgi:hypothetical protein
MKPGWTKAVVGFAHASVSKKSGGKWLYVRDAWNSNKPSAPAATTGT